MKIVEALKRLRVIEKRMTSNSQAVNQYCSKVSTELPQFSTVDEQKEKVKSLIQANKDLMDEYLGLKKNIEYTNLITKVEIGGRGYSLSDLLVIKRKMARTMMGTYSVLNDQRAQERMRYAPTFEDKKPQIEILYSEKDKLEGLQKWQDLADNISSRLEVVNATSDLREYVI